MMRKTKEELVSIIERNEIVAKNNLKQLDEKDKDIKNLQQQLAIANKQLEHSVEKFIIIEHNERDFVLASRTLNQTGSAFIFLGRFKSRIKVSDICHRLNKGEQ